MDLENAIDRLYQLPLAEFTAERNALAKTAGARGADVRALSKPPLAAWAVNQLFWRERRVYDALIEAATTMRAAHGTVLSGRRADLRAAGKEHEDALETALKTTIDLVEGSGQPVTDATRQAIATTLRGLPGEEPPGRLTRVLQPGGFEMLAGISIKPGPPKSPSRATSSTTARGSRTAESLPAADQDDKALAQAREAVEAAARALKLAEQNARREEFEAARAVREADKAARALESARAELESAERAVDEASREAEAATRRRERADARARESTAAVAAAQAGVAGAERTLASMAKKRGTAGAKKR